MQELHGLVVQLQAQAQHELVGPLLAEPQKPPALMAQQVRLRVSQPLMETCLQASRPLARQCLQTQSSLAQPGQA